MTRTRLLIVGGFLGAGKTTLLARAGQMLSEQGYRVGLVTNDQGSDLVDTSLLQQRFPVTEVVGGCFCCAFPDLLQALRQLQDTVQPDVILAEPVGSCTDLLSTVLRPLAAHYPGQFEIAPLTIAVDVTRDAHAFSPNVLYLFERQMEEAEVILLNKMDLLAEDAAQEQQAAMRARYPNARLLPVCARTGEGLDAWLQTVLVQISSSPLSMDMDYQRYAEAEAELGWLNVKGMVRSSAHFSAHQWTTSLLQTLTQALGDARIAHVKVHTSTAHATYKASVTQNHAAPSWDTATQDIPADQLEFILNARVSADPAMLEQCTLQSIEAVKPDPLARVYLTHFECFRPLPPRPTYRMVATQNS